LSTSYQEVHSYWLPVHPTGRTGHANAPLLIKTGFSLITKQSSRHFGHEGIRPPAGEFFCHFQTRRFVVVPWNTVITDPQGLFGATLHAGLAFDAQFFLHQGVGRQVGGGEN
jgi:hypothetical protein